MIIPVIFFTHVQGFDGFTDEFLSQLLVNIMLRNVCESHGAMHGSRG